MSRDHQVTRDVTTKSIYSNRMWKWEVLGEKDGKVEKRERDRERRREG